jgi:hypothetical protein
MPRTGTLTQKLALEQLGFDPCYHWVNLLADLDEVLKWDRALDGEGQWQEIFDGAQASVDWPGGYVYRELMDVYPDAKVLLSVRQPESWERSFRDTIWTMSHGESLMPLLARARGEVDPRWKRYMALVDRMFWGPQGSFSKGYDTPAQLIEQMLAHNEEVERSVPAERLLVWNVTDGWEPLCEFLGVDVPDGPLPHANDRDTFLDRVVGGALDALTAWREEQAKTAA